MPKLLKAFQLRYPGVEFVIHQGDYTSIQEWIRTGVIDFGFASPKAVNDLELIVLKEGAMTAVLPERHPLAEYDVVPLKALAAEPFILLEDLADSGTVRVKMTQRIMRSIKNITCGTAPFFRKAPWTPP